MKLEIARYIQKTIQRELQANVDRQLQRAVRDYTEVDQAVDAGMTYSLAEFIEKFTNAVERNRDNDRKLDKLHDFLKKAVVTIQRA